MSAISHQNFSAALRILHYVQTHVSSQPNLDPSNSDPSNQPNFDPTISKPSELCRGTESATNSSSPSSDLLLQSAVFAPGLNGITPLQAVLASFSSFYDCKAMALHVSSIPVTYTAQQLLKLFQTRYPSAYKVEVFKAQDTQVRG